MMEPEFSFLEAIMNLPKNRALQLCLAIAMLATVSVAIAEDAQPPLVVMKGVKDVQTPEYKQYQYGMPLDIAKVIKIEYFPPKEKFCGVIPAALTYVDSKGDKRGLVYLFPETSGCTN